jgi:hypothetical protein
VRLLPAALATLAGVVVAPAAGVPAELTGDRLDRGARLAEASIYTVDAIYRKGRGLQPVRGLAFAVTPDGRLLAARHVVERGGRQPARVIVRQAARVDTGPSWVARVEAADADTDLALLRIDVRGAPALVIDESGSRTAVVTFGRPSGRGVTIRKGHLGPTQQVSKLQRIVTRLSIRVEPGESGSPVVDGRGRVVGMTLGFLETSRDGFMEPAASLDRLLQRAQVTNDEGAAATSFREGMSALWRLDPERAKTSFLATQAMFPDHPLIDDEIEAAEAVADADYDIGPGPRGRGLLLAGGAASGVAALGFGLALAAGSTRRRRWRRQELTARHDAGENLDEE